MQTTSDWLLGLGGSDHDASATLMHGCDIRVAVEQERLSRRKYGLSFWYQNPLQQATNYCLQTEGLSLEDVGLVTSSDTVPARVRRDFNIHREYPHHLCHAASAYMLLPPTARAGIIVYDGFGSVRAGKTGDKSRHLRETISFFLFEPTRYDCLGSTLGHAYSEKDEFPIGVTNSLGMFYEMITAILGYELEESGKTMGLSAFGAPTYLDLMGQFVTLSLDANACFQCPTDNPRFLDQLEGILRSRQNSFSARADLAASAQGIFNRSLAHCATFFQRHDLEYLCLAGGCALNTVATSFLIEDQDLRIPVVTPAHCGDAGLGLGALWLTLFDEQGSAPALTFRGRPINPSVSRPGRTYTAEEHRQAVQTFYPRLALDSSVNSGRALAKCIAGGAVVGVLNGGSEIGPRALGGRSIFADPRTIQTRERINRVLKRREPYRPLAPIVLSRVYDDYFFDSRMADPFMLKVARARTRCLTEAPAIVHVDGTARVQVVGPMSDPFLIELLEAFLELTGVGLLLNTSFNRRGEPLVETPSDAIDAFLGMGLDGLYLDGAYYVPAEEPRPRV